MNITKVATFLLLVSLSAASHAKKIKHRTCAIDIRQPEVASTTDREILNYALEEYGYHEKSYPSEEVVAVLDIRAEQTGVREWVETTKKYPQSEAARILYGEKLLPSEIIKTNKSCNDYRITTKMSGGIRLLDHHKDCSQSSNQAVAILYKHHMYNIFKDNKLPRCKLVN